MILSSRELNIFFLIILLRVTQAPILKIEFGTEVVAVSIMGFAVPDKMRLIGCYDDG